MTQKHFARKRRQLKYAVKQLKRILASRKENNKKHIGELILKIRLLTRDLSAVLPPFRIKGILGTLAITLGISFTQPLFAQTFEGPTENPFGITNTGYYSLPVFVDLDSDGDMDIVHPYFIEGSGGYNDPGMLVTMFVENMGSANSPQFTTPVQNTFGMGNEDGYLPTFGDLDNDGDLDVIAGNGINLNYQENIGTATNPQFAPQIENPLGLSSLVEPDNDNFVMPELVDLDGDGDLDLAVLGTQFQEGPQEATSILFYFENTGTVNAPQFAPAIEIPLGMDTPILLKANFTDLDMDGDLDIFTGSYLGDIYYYENTGTASNAVFGEAQQNPFGIQPVYYFSYPTLADLDNDGDVDLLTGEYYGNMQYYENTGTVSVSEIPEDIELDVLPNPFVDHIRIKSEINISTISVYDPLGKLVQEYHKDTRYIDTKKWNPGLYLIQIKDEEGRMRTMKIKKE